MVSSLNHPHILTVHDVGSFEDREYLVTEFVDGGTLKEWLHPADHSRRTWRQVVELLTGVADGLAAALFDDVRDDPRMKALVSRLKFPDFALN